jgi:predicted dehydrogenase/threonine dehydrogenase-like Zn-dependent dehydrogenase
MKQTIQNLKTGETCLEEIPVPSPGYGEILIRTTHSLVSLGTEKMLVEFSKANLIQKAKQQPDKVKQVLDKIKADGLLPTVETVFKRLEEPLPLGYCNSGVVVETGQGVTGFAQGDRVASNGKHSEYVCVPVNLVAKVPERVSSEEAAFTVIGSISLQGIRLCKPEFGETIVVFGLGLLGLIAVQMLLSNGCRVIGIDIDKRKCDMAGKWGADTINASGGDDPVKVVMEATEGIGADGVIITASSRTHEIISQAARMSRKRGRIILVGVIGLNINRAEFYEKELSFQVSCSYGPGRYDENYEKKGIDYPLPFVRWTEQRNFEAVLEAIASGNLNVRELITETVKLHDYNSIYGDMSRSGSIASILEYPGDIKTEERSSTVILKSQSFSGAKAVTGFIGAGNFTKMTMLPSLKGTGARFKYIASSGGVSGTTLAKKFGFALSTTDHNEILNDAEVDTVFITTRHNSHAKFVIESLKAGKNVFVEKPLAINDDQLSEIIKTYQECRENDSPATLTVGFNRRFSPHTQAIKHALGKTPGEMNIAATMNAGFIPYNVWVHDMEVGGGRIIGEACHYMDLCVYLSGSEISAVCMNSMGKNPKENSDNASILLRFKNGSNAVINYFANGSKSYSKERIEVYSHERVIIMDNFRTTRAYGIKGFKNLKTRIDKGHRAQFAEYIRRIREGGEPLIDFDQIVNVTKASFAAIKSLRGKCWVDVE